MLFSCAKQQNHLKKLKGNAIGTTYSIKYKDSKNRNFSTEIQQLINQSNQSISTYLPTSTISKINKGSLATKVDSIFKEVFQKSMRIYNETDGVFDPTVGNLVNAWGFGPEKLEKPDTLQIKQMLTYVGLDKVTLTNDTIKKKYVETYIDFNAIGKGYLIDLIGRMFEKNNIENYLVEVGGEIRARGVNEKGRYWAIGIDNPNTDGTRSYSDIIFLKNESMATSGNYRKFRVDKNGKKYVHTINPKTGMATESDLLSVSVIAKTDCADVDGYATAFMAMGFHKTVAFLKKHPHLKVHLIYVNRKSEIKTYTTLPKSSYLE